MRTAVMESDSKEDLDLLIRIAKKLGMKAVLLSEEEVEDICLHHAIEEGRMDEHVDPDRFMADLRR